MMTLYGLALRILNLSHAEAADLHGVSIDTVRSWSSGRNRVPASAWNDLRGRWNLVREHLRSLHRECDMRGSWSDEGNLLHLTIDECDSARGSAQAILALERPEPILDTMAESIVSERKVRRRRA